MKKLLLSLMVIAGTAQAATGIGTTEPFDTVKITSGVDGEVIFYGKEIGEVLSQDEILVKLDDEQKLIERDLAKINLEKAIVDRDHYKKKTKRYKKLVKEKNLSESDYDDMAYQFATAKNDIKVKELNLKNAERELSDTKVYGLDNYIVSKRNVEIGDYVQASTVLYEAMDINNLKVRMLLDEKMVSLLNIGQEVNISVDENDKHNVKGIVTQIGLAMEEGTYAYPVLIKVENPYKDIPISKTVYVEF